MCALRRLAALAGEGVRIARDAFLVAGYQSRPLRWLATHADAFAQLMQSAACNARHNVERCLAHWLCTVTDRPDRSSLPIPHHTLAQISGRC
jgi:hypothetical protein